MYLPWMSEYNKIVFGIDNDKELEEKNKKQENKKSVETVLDIIDKMQNKCGCPICEAAHLITEDLREQLKNGISKDQLREKIKEVERLKYEDGRLDRPTVDLILMRFKELLKEE